MRRKLNEIERLALKRIFSSDRGLHPYTLFSYLRVSYSEYHSALTRLAERGYVQSLDESLKITPEGILVAQLVVNDASERNWREVPDEIKRPKLQVNEKYVPSIRKIKDLS